MIRKNIMVYNTLATKESIDKTIAALKARNIEVLVVENGKVALEKIKEFVPKGVSIMNGVSRTLEQIGFIDYLKTDQHGWNNLHQAILAEQDQAKQAILRRQAVLADYYLGSVHALAETGEFIIASNTGSQLSHIVYTSTNLILVVGAQKIVPMLADAFKRLEDYVVPLENARMQQLRGVGTVANKIVVFNGENPRMGRKLRLILVNENLGF